MENLVVIHEISGVGVIQSRDKGRVNISLGRPVTSPLLRDARMAPSGKKLLMDRIEAEEPGLSMSITEERFFNHPEWSLAPTKMRFLRVCNEIKITYSPVIVPTLNPPNPMRAKAAIEARLHKMLLRDHRPVFDDQFIALRNHLIFLLDSQLSYHLIRGDESYWDYQERIESFNNSVDRNVGWSQFLSMHDDELGANERILDYATVLVHVAVAHEGMSYTSAIQYVIGLFEARIRLYKSTIRGFIRSKNKRS